MGGNTVHKTVFAALAVLSICSAPAPARGAELLRNGSFEQWTEGRPTFWSGSNVRREQKLNFHGSGVTLFRGEDSRVKSELVYSGLALKPLTEYRLELFYRVYNLSGGTVDVQIHHEGKRIVHVATLRVHYWHSKGTFVPLEFSTRAAPIDPAKCSLHFIYRGGKEGVAVIDEVSLSPANDVATGVLFEAGEGGKATLRASIHNNRERSRKITWSLKLVNFFNEPVEKAGWEDARTLRPGERVKFSHTFYADRSKAYRATLNLDYGDGSRREIVKYFEPVRYRMPRPTLRLDLLGGWQRQFVSASSPDPVEDGWRDVTLPDKAERGDHKWGRKGKLDLERKRYVWYRLHFDGPELPAGSRAVLRLARAPLSPVVFLNGEKVGAAAGRVPVELDVTDAYKPGETNLLELRLSTWREFVREWERGVYRTIPFGLETGITAPVTLQVRPGVYIARVSCFPSVRGKKLTVRYLLVNDSQRNASVTLSGVVFGEGERAVRIASNRRYLSAGDRMWVWREVSWPKPHLWFHHDPYLYRLTSTLKSDLGKVADEVSTRFGFREVWTEGPNFLINGRKLYMPARLSFPHMTHVGGKLNRSNTWAMLRFYKDNGLTHARDYTTYPVFHREVADEIGFTLRESFELNLAYGGQRWMPKLGGDYWLTCADYVRAFALEMANHPSIVMWDMQNETFLCSVLNRHPEIADEFVKLHGVLRAMLPGALVTHDDGYNPRNDADVTLLHYPFVFIRYFPRQRSFPGRVFSKGRRYLTQLGSGSFTWYGDHPLGLGECHMVSGSYPASLTYLFGDEDVYRCAYRGSHQWSGDWGPMIRAHNEQLKVLFRLYREAGLCLINPWPWSDEAIKETMVENVVYLKQYDRNFKGGAVVKRTAVVVHGSSLEREAAFKWTLMAPSGAKVASKTIKLPRLRDGEVSYQDFSFVAPPVREKIRLTLRLEVIAEEGTIAQSEFPIKVWPAVQIRKPQGLKVVLYDALGSTVRALSALKIPFKRVETLAEWEIRGANLAIVGKNALSGQELMRRRRDLLRYVSDGGRVLVLAQARHLPDWLPIRCNLRLGHFWRRAHIRIADHPLVNGLEKDDLMFWGGDANTSAFDYFKPFSGNFLPVLDSGSMQGLANTPLMEIPHGDGSFLLCQMAIVEKAADEPAAKQLWQNILDYAAAPLYRETKGRAVVLATVDSNLAQFTRRFRFDAEVVDPRFASAVSFRHAAAVIVDGSIEFGDRTLNSLIAYARAGGNVWVHGVTKKTADQWSALVPDLEVRPLEVRGKKGDSRTTKIADDPVIAGLSNSDLYWKGVPRFGWAGEDYGTPFVGTIVNTRLSASAPAKVLTEYGNLIRCDLGRGLVLIDNILWDAAWRELSFRAPRVPSLIATNLGVKVFGGPNDRVVAQVPLKFTPVNLEPFFNLDLTDVLPGGLKKYAEVPFMVKAPGKGAVMLGSKRLADKWATKRFPEKVEGIPVDAEAHYLYFLQTAWDVYESGPGWGPGEVYGGYRINYTDGTAEYAPLQGFIHATIPCDYHGDLPRAVIAWPEREPSEVRASQTIFAEWLDTYVRLEGRWIQREHPNRLYCMRWTNPFPKKVIKSIDFIGANAFVHPILLAVTAAAPKESVP